MILKEKNNLTLSLCGDRDCDCGCPEAFVEDDGMVTLTDDNDLEKAGLRKIKLTKEQFIQLLEEGKELAKSFEKTEKAS